MKRVIAIGLAPNIQKDDALESLRLLFSPWRYLHGKAIRQLEHFFEQYFSVPQAISFISARAALYAIFKNLEIGRGDEVLLQAFTCVAVPNAIIATGAKPIYVDINERLNIDISDLERKISSKTKAILVQHTFGIPADMDAITKIAKKHNLYIVEDVAHTIGGEYNGKKLGTFGVASVFSFGRDKAFSSVFGGIAISRDETFGQILRTYQKQRDYPSVGWIISQLFYPVISYIILRLYYVFSLGKALHFALRKVQFFSLPVSFSEKKGIFTPLQVQRIPNALAQLACIQVRKLEKYNMRRKEFSGMYDQFLKNLEIDTINVGSEPLLRYPLLAGDKKDMQLFFAKRGVYVGDWYNQAIDPLGVEMAKVYYKKGSCPHAEETAQHSINLPTYPTMTEADVKKVMTILKQYASH